MWRIGNCLRSLIYEITQAFNLTPSPYTQAQGEEITDARLQFLLKLLQVIRKSYNDAKVVYPLLDANTDKLDRIFPQILRRWARDKFEEVEVYKALFIATDIGNFGNLIAQFPRGDRASNLEIAIAGNETILNVYTREAFPRDHAQTLLNLGRVYQDAGKFGDAYNKYESAIATVEFLRGEIVLGEEIKRKQAEQWNQLYRRMVEVCLELERDTEAVEYIERSKTRNLVELLFKDELYPKGEIPAEVTQQLQELRKEIETEKQRLQQTQDLHTNNINTVIATQVSAAFPQGNSNPKHLTSGTDKINTVIATQGSNPKPLEIGNESVSPNNLDRTRLNQLREQREELISRVIGFKPIRFREIHNLLDENTAIVEWYIFNDCFRAFVITRDRNKPKDKPEIWCSSAEDLEKLVDWKDKQYLQPYSQDKKLWRHEVKNKLTDLAKILHLNEVISLVPENCKKLIIVPHRYLHLLPIHALELSNGEYLIDRFTDGVSYAPSCQLLRIAREKSSSFKQYTSTSNLFAIQNPTNDLEFTDIEVETIAPNFNNSHILKHSEVTKTALKQPENTEKIKNANLVHFSCHAYFDFESPLKSGLQLANSSVSSIPSGTESSRFLKLPDGKKINLEKCLTLEDIFELNLSNCRLVTLSACETGLVDSTNTSDEYIGLASGFIRAGVPSIVSSLWAVDDFSTAILMIKFYEEIEKIENHSNISIALKETQRWLRSITQKDLLQWIDDNQNMTPQNKEKIKNRLEPNYKPEEQPFENPCFWAAFCAVGE